MASLKPSESLEIGLAGASEWPASREYRWVTLLSRDIDNLKSFGCGPQRSCQNLYASSFKCIFNATLHCTNNLTGARHRAGQSPALGTARERYVSDGRSESRLAFFARILGKHTMRITNEGCL
jgi:hypothetical protein